LKELKIDDLDVDEAYIVHIFFAIGGPRVSIVAPEDQGKRIAERLKELESEHALEFVAQDGAKRRTGLCDIRDLKIEEDASKTPILYRITCVLQTIG